MSIALPSVQDVAAYWDRRPCNIRHSTKAVGTKEYFDDVEARKYFVEPHIPGFAEFTRWSGKRVLEVGCGMGTDATNFARGGADYTGIELSRASMELAQQRFKLFGLKGEFHNLNAEVLASKLPQASYDLVYSFGVIHHTPDPEAVFAQIRKVIKPDGEFRMMLYAKNSWKDAMIRAGLDQPEAEAGCPIAFTYTPEEVEAMMDRAGFKATSIQNDHIFPYIVEKYVRYEYEAQPWFRAMPKEMFEALEKALGWHLLIKAKPV
jgi:SAM-dependent methyltransferase